MDCAKPARTILQKNVEVFRGELFTREPSGPNMAQEKSRRSLMLTLMLVRCRTLPICSAMPMNLQRSWAMQNVMGGGRGGVEGEMALLDNGKGRVTRITQEHARNKG